MKKLLLIIIVISGLFTFTSKASACPFAQKDIEKSKREIYKITLSTIPTNIGYPGGLATINFYKNYLVRVMQACPSIAIKHEIPQYVDIADIGISALKTRLNRPIPHVETNPISPIPAYRK